MRLSLDTNRYTDFWNGDEQVRRVVESAEEIHLPLIVVAELRAGFLIGTRASENEKVLQAFCAKQGVSILPPDEQTTHHYAVLQRQLRQQGTPMPLHDVWIAALVIQHGLTLFTRDRHFDHLPQLMRI